MKRSAFTLVELLVVIAIIGILVGLLLVAIQKTRESANKAGCQNNLKQIGLALHTYHDSKGHFPPGYVSDSETDPAATAPGWGWAAHLLPFVEEANLHESIDFKIPVDDPAHAAARSTVVRVFVCPSDRSTGVFTVPGAAGGAQAATNSYAACFGALGEIGDEPGEGNGIFYRNSKISIEQITDGTSHTIAIGDRAALFTQTPWAGAFAGGITQVTPGAPVTSTATEPAATQPLAHTGSHTLNHPESDPDDFFSPHSSMGLFLFADGSVRSVPTNLSLAVFQALSTRAGKENIDTSAY